MFYAHQKIIRLLSMVDTGPQVMKQAWYFTWQTARRATSPNMQIQDWEIRTIILSAY